MSDYITLHDEYHQVPIDADGVLPENYFFGQRTTPDYECLSKFRCFVPPGTIQVTLCITGTGEHGTMSRHKRPPTAEPIGGATQSLKLYKIDQLIAGDCAAVEESSNNQISIVYDDLLTPIGIDRAGWLYVKFGGSLYEGLCIIYYSVKVISADFNNWWSAYIKDAAGWKSLIEDVETYIVPVEGSAPTPVNWAATEASDWLTITSGASGTGDGEIVCDYTGNTSSSTRTGTIKITNSDTEKLLTSVTVTQSSTDTLPITTSGAKTVVTAMASRLSSVSQARRNVMQKLTELGDIKSAIESGLSAAATSLISANPVAKTINYFMTNKVAGSFGSYGIASQIGKLEAMKDAMTNEMDFCKTAISMYNQIDMGATSLLGIDSLSSIPGFDSSTYPDGFDDTMTIGEDDYHPDMDHPKSKNMLAKASDLRMINRPGENPDDAITPDNPEIGDLICIYGIVYIYTNDPEDYGDQLWYPLGIQELCQITSGKAKYDKTHTKTESVEKPAEEVGYMYEPFCKDDPETT